MNDSFKAVTALLPEPVREEIADITRGGRSEITEIRLRAGQTSSYRVCMRGTQIEKMAAGRVLCDKELINECINKFIKEDKHVEIAIKSKLSLKKDNEKILLVLIFK